MDENSLPPSSYQLILTVVEVYEVNRAELAHIGHLNIVIVLVEEDEVEFGSYDEIDSISVRKCNCRNRAMCSCLFHHFYGFQMSTSVHTPQMQ